ncbi:polysaccharide biosynthesis/export family protein [Dankookia sp. P2]|uniref:polysaccharide biosynthesis/export family protein n=1 Tax=Dankookia sp. P2 TaxID=3423955 RepID=UPI003D6716AF
MLNRTGTETQSEGGPVAVGPLGDGSRVAGATAVFGASLFTREATAVSDAPNPNYVIVPGDRVSVRVWGAVEAEVVGQVDPSGMLFLPNIGPIRVAGTRAGDLQQDGRGRGAEGLHQPGAGLRRAALHPAHRRLRHRLRPHARPLRRLGGRQRGGLPGPRRRRRSRPRLLP